jgi:hypothetical protein
MITAPHMPYRIPLVMLCGLMIATVACNATPIAKVEPAATPTASTAPSCQEALPIVGGGIVEFIQYKDIDELIKSADLIVVGTPLTELGPETTLRSMKARDRYDDFKMPLNQSLVITDPNGGTTADWTLTGFKVEQTLKGKLPATNLQILEPGIVISGKSVPKQKANVIYYFSKKRSRLRLHSLIRQSPTQPHCTRGNTTSIGPIVPKPR